MFISVKIMRLQNQMLSLFLFVPLIEDGLSRCSDVDWILLVFLDCQLLIAVRLIVKRL